MNNIRDAIIRVGRSVRLLEQLEGRKVLKSTKKVAKIIPTSNVHKKQDQKLEDKELNKYKFLLLNYQRKIYQDFLAPLNMPSLKVFNNELPKYNEESAVENWHRKKKKDSLATFEGFIQDRTSFHKMMDLLVKVTPNNLKLEEDRNINILGKILADQENQELEHTYPYEFPRHVFTEVPPIPIDLTVESFQKYIYHLTHLTFYYKNSLSLKSGIVADILLYTHRLDNEKFKQYRSVHTYNYLMHYFGYIKNQSSFARELLLVMNKDGHKPNIQTINNLLKLCRTHSNIRSITNTYDIVTKYLKLCHSLNIPVNLTTYNRIYDSINNIFLKEIFLDKLNMINLPILKNLVLRILDDYMKVTTDNPDLINFIESELNYMDWRNDFKVFNKVLYHKCVNLDSEELICKISDLSKNEKLDNYSLKYIIESIRDNKKIHNKAQLMLTAYVVLAKNNTNIANIPIIYKLIVHQLINGDYDLFQTSFFTRGLIHDATLELGLPGDITFYGLKQTDPENYKIFKRIVGLKICTLDAKISYANRNQVAVPSLKTPLSSDEVNRWSNIKHKLASPYSTSSLHKLVLENDAILSPAKSHVPASYIERYEFNEWKKMNNFRANERVLRLKKGNQAYVYSQLKDRSII